MALRRDWYTLANVTVPPQATDMLTDRAVLWTWKQTMKGGPLPAAFDVGNTGARPASSYWTVAGSSDGTTAGHDGVDRWGDVFDAAKVPQGNGGAGGGPRAWIVLKSPDGMLPVGNLYLLIYYTTNIAGTTQSYNCELWISLQPFAGGSATTRPTIAGEHQINQGSTVFNDSAAGRYVTSHRWHFVTDANGYFFLAMTRSSLAAPVRSCFAVWPTVAPAEDAQPWFCWHSFNAAGAAQPIGTNFGGNKLIGRLLSNAAFSWQAVVVPHMVLTTGANNSVVDAATAPNPWTQRWDEWPAQLCQTTVGQYQLRGVAEDWSLVASAAPLFNTTPEVGPIERVNFGGLVVPMSYVPVP
jgi:hypothetical protein